MVEDGDIPTSTRMGAWDNRPRATIEEARASARRARRLRASLPILGLGVTLAFIMNLREPGLAANPVIDEFGLKRQGDVMVDPHYAGEDATGRPFKLEAAEARRRPSSNVVEFVRPTAFQPHDDRPPRTARADRGAFGETANRLDLQGRVQLDMGDGHLFATDRAVVDFDRDRVDGVHPVRGDGPLGSIEAEAFSITNGGERLVFSGEVRLVIDAEALDVADEAGEGEEDVEGGDAGAPS